MTDVVVGGARQVFVERLAAQSIAYDAEELRPEGAARRDGSRRVEVAASDAEATEQEPDADGGVALTVGLPGWKR
jgi:hypothetical protein